MSKKPKKFGKTEKTYSERILKILSQNANKPFNYKQIAAILELDDTKSRNEIIKDLKILAAQKVIIESEPGKYLVKAISQDYYEGTIDMTSRKTAYFICEEFEDDVFIPTNNLNHALDKDKVKQDKTRQAKKKLKIKTRQDMATQPNPIQPNPT